MAFNWYSRELEKGHAGMIANTTVHNIDSYIVDINTGIEPGDPVIRTADNRIKVPATAEEAAKVIGVAVHQHKEPQEPYYAPGETVPVMTMGDIYVQAHSDVAAEESAGINVTDDGRAIFTKGTVTEAAAGSRTYTVTTNFAADDTVAVGGVTVRAVAKNAESGQFVVGANINASVTALVALLGAQKAISDKYTVTANGAAFTITEKTAGGGNTPGEAKVTGTGKITNGKAASSTAASSTVADGFKFMEAAEDGDIVRLRIRR